MGPLTRSQIPTAAMQLSGLEEIPVLQSADHPSHERDTQSPTHSSNVGAAANTTSAVRASGSQPPSPVSLELATIEYWSSVDPPADDDVTTHQYLTEMRHRLKETCKIARDHLQNAQEKSINYANQRARIRTLQPGDHVLIILADSPKKLLMSWRGPYVVLKCIRCYNYVLDIDGVRQIQHINLLRKYFIRFAVDVNSTTPQAEPQAAAALAVAP